MFFKKKKKLTVGVPKIVFIFVCPYILTITLGPGVRFSTPQPVMRFSDFSEIFFPGILRRNCPKPVNLSFRDLSCRLRKKAR